MTEKIITRLKADAVKYHPKISAYSQALVNCAEANQSSPVIEDGFWFIGDVIGEFYRLKYTKDNRKEKLSKWIRLDSYDKCLELKEM